MPSSTHDRGRYVESRCADLMAAEGWRVIARNVRTPCGEIDLVGVDGSGDEAVLVAVEVKTQAESSWVSGEDLLRPRQRRRLARALEWLVQGRGWQGACRLDLAVALRADNGEIAFEWHRDIEAG